MKAGASSTTGAPTGPMDWNGIGQYLHNEDVQLISPVVRRQLSETWKDITHQEETLDDAILIGLVGGTGVGKSTFINALAGQEVSRSSDRRPTTDRVIVYRHVNTEMSAEVPTADFAQPEVLHDNELMEKIVLFDFPDFDSAEDSHTHIIRKYLPHLDVLLVVVDDVKYADRRLYELLASLNHDPSNIFVLLNKVDRLNDRYGDDVERVIGELIADLDEKLRKHGGLELHSGQKFPIAALSVYQARVSQLTTPAFERFSQVETMLAGFQIAKYRRAAKERNIDSRKRELVATLAEQALGESNEAILKEARLLVHSWRAELDKALRSVPVEILNTSERQSLRGSRLGQVGPSWGIPFSLFFTLLGEIGRRSTKVVEPAELGQRVMYHYRSFFEAIKNVRARFTSELSGSNINLSALEEVQGSDLLKLSPSKLASELQIVAQQEQTTVPLGRRWLAHIPALGTLAMAFWSKVYNLLDGERGILGSLFDTLSPSFLVGTILGVIMVYAATALVIWLREIQSLESELVIAEQKTREIIRKDGQDAVDLLDADVRTLNDEFERLELLLGQ